jgi:hypothetical protein
MNKPLKILQLILISVIVVGSVTFLVLHRRKTELANNPPDSTMIRNPIDWESLSPKQREELISSLRFDEMNFSHQTLEECLGTLYGRTCSILGGGFRFSIKEPAGSPSSSRRLSLMLRNVTFREVLKALGEASDATIYMTEYGIQATIGKTPGTKPEPSQK